ncbi:hypothetical protein [Patulibacter sp.]|uniref:hypothetical protein n=1 Tax=Patulibacter sp. TaxID=1912859 RepID=UPI0027233D9C|nr:hypothetical protein [Patulibacter sp.]MDO9409694.1 hypothetical protein [Patulibacter sp.]
MSNEPTRFPLRANQQYRDVRKPHEDAKIVTVDSVEGTNVLGTSKPEGGAYGTQAGAWSPIDLGGMTLVYDPGWAAYEVKVNVWGFNGDLQQKMRFIGSVNDTGGEVTPSNEHEHFSVWEVVAPSPEDASALVASAAHGLAQSVRVEVVGATPSRRH